MSGCRRGCQHRALIDAYRDARQAQEAARDNAVGTYGPDSPEWAEHPQPTTLHDWLTQMRGAHDEPRP